MYRMRVPVGDELATRPRGYVITGLLQYVMEQFRF